MASRNIEKKEFLDYLFTEVNKIPLGQVIGEYVELEQRGRHLLGLCPFHNDTSLGSFVVTEDRNFWKCFAEEGVGGYGPLSFVVMYEHEVLHNERATMTSAAFDLGRKFGIISDEEYTAYSGKRYDPGYVEQIRHRIDTENRRKDQSTQRRPRREVLAMIYKAMAAVCPLSEADRHHLLKERMLKEAQLGDYFTFPTRHTDLVAKILLYIRDLTIRVKFGKKKEEDLTADEAARLAAHMMAVRDGLINAPGFYLNTETGKIDFISFRGIGFLVRDEMNTPVAVHIRKTRIKPGEQRYVWFSSAFAAYDQKAEGGSSSGAPAGFLKARNTKDPANAPLYVTEGRFKAEKIADAGNHVIYLSGVSTWKNAAAIIDRIAPSRDIYLAFDADLMGNPAVYGSLKAMGEYLTSRGHKTFSVMWPIACGKGYDDLVIKKGRQYKRYVKQLLFGEFQEKYEKALQDTLNLFNVRSIPDLPRDKGQEFQLTLQKAVENAVFSG